MPVELTADIGPLDDAPLELALVQVRTSPVLAVERSAPVEALASALPDDWALVDEGQAQRVELQLGPGGVQPSSGSVTERLWRFETTDRRYVTTLTSTSIGIETRQYDVFDEFRQRVEEFLGGVHADEELRPRYVTRLGMRYVDQLRDSRLADDYRRSEVVRPDLLGPAASLGSDLVASLQELRFQQANGVLAVRHGLTEPEQYLLDLDHYSDERQDFVPDDLIRILGEWHDTIEGVFAWAFGPWLAEREAASR